MPPTARSAALSDKGEWTRVIVLAPQAASSPSSSANLSGQSPAAGALSESLRRQFAERDWFAVVHHDPYLALAELALRDRAQTTRAAWGLQRMEGIALVVLQPDAWPGDMRRDLIAAARRCVNAATIWTARDDRIEPAEAPAPAWSAASAYGSNPLLSASESTPLEALINPMQPPTTLDIAPNATSNGEDSASPARDAAAEAPAGDEQFDRTARLSRDEIDMLLCERDDDQPQDAAVDDGGATP